jgi:hypothetical protein
MAPTMWALVGLGSIELLAVHLFVSLKWSWLAWPLSAMTLLSLGWFVLLIRSFRQRPHQLGPEFLHLHLGRLRSVSIPRSLIATCRGVLDAAEVKARDTADFHLLSYPNRIVELSSPVLAGRRDVNRVALALDDPAAFDLALSA